MLVALVAVVGGGLDSGVDVVPVVHRDLASSLRVVRLPELEDVR